MMPPTRSTSSSGRAFTTSASCATRTCSRARKWYASVPTSASTRRTPEPIEDSLSSFTRPRRPVLSTCVPPHSSCAHSPTETTRTRSPYFSPNSAIAPIALASGWLITCARDREVVDQQLVDPLLDVRQHRVRDRARGGEVEAEAAGRVLRTRLGRGLAEQLAERLVHHVRRGVRAGDRRAARGVHLAPRLGAQHAPRRRARSPRCAIRSPTGFCTSTTSASAPLPSRIRPWSASWPPPSA